MRWRKNNLHQESHTTPSLMSPGQVYEVHVSAWNTSYIFNRNHKIRVAVSSSNYPRFSTNLNNGGSVVAGGAPVLANNTVWFSEDRPSHFTLPVVSLEAIPKSEHVRPIEADDEALMKLLGKLVAKENN